MCPFYDPKFEYHIQAFDQELQKPLILILNQYLVFFFIFLARFWRFFTPYKATYIAQMIGFPLFFLIKFKRFFINWILYFFSCFFIEFRRFFHQLNTRFFYQFFSKFKRFFLSKPWSQMLICLSELASKRKDNFNIIKLYNLLCDKSNLIKTISYLPKVDLLLIIRHFFLDQLSKSTYVINFFNQTIIELATSPVYDMLLFQTYIYKRVYSYLLSYIWFKINLLTDYPFVKLWNISLLSTFSNNIDKSSTRYSLNISFVQTLALSIYKCQDFD